MTFIWELTPEERARLGISEEDSKANHEMYLKEHPTTFVSVNADIVAAALGVPVEFLRYEPPTASEVHLQILQGRRARLMPYLRAINPCPDCMEMRFAEAVVDLESNCICPPPPEKFDTVLREGKE